MRFEVSERIRTEKDSGELLSAIEAQFKKVSRQVSLSDSTIVAKSIEATFGSINRYDTTTITLREDAQGFLAVADVYYRPSVAFWIFIIVGLFTWVLWVIPIIFYLVQKKSVRAAIEDCFRRIKNEFDQQIMVPSRSSETPSLDDIEKLAALREKGLITDGEFEEKKKQILGLR